MTPRSHVRTPIRLRRSRSHRPDKGHDGPRQEAVMNVVALEISRVLYDASVVVIISLEPPLPTTSDA